MNTMQEGTAMEVIIRRARAEEVPEVQAIELDGAKTYCDLPGYEFCATLPPRSEEEHAIARNTGVSLVVEADGVPIGFLLVSLVDGEPHIVETAVSRNFQRKGVGTKLFDKAEEWSRLKGAVGITLTTFRDVPWNAPAYARRGYETLDEDSLRADLREVVREETEAGFAQRPRVAMRKKLVAR